ncbi:heterodisulfide reductase-related iron-sulfur binding cluster [Nocardioides sp. SR21]|uniref:heterodisulfide reductase-related iron-sulfur binding cluster n=1 Tax=Nocardioides sp. SR21 TaxID=2919501 RepID=UPI001FAA171D|nr:heterodisulfide reductase-related iron-sulfur binding cluster [Nocardioides sp. SR21]
MSAVLIVGILINVIALPIVARRVAYLYRVITAGQPAPDRVVGVTGRIGKAISTLIVEVLAQRKLLKWTIPGAAHAFVMWAFIILGSVYVEAYGSLFTFPEGWAIPIIGHWEILGFLQDFIAVMCLLGIITFAMIRLKQSPLKLGRQSRFDGSHTGGAWLVLFMIFNVLWTMFLFRGASAATGNLPYDNGAFVSIWIGDLLDGLSHDTLEVLEGLGLILHIGVMLVFLIDVVHSKHLHIFLAPLNVLFKRQPVALGAVKPLISQGKPITLDDVDDLDEDTVLGVGKIEDYSWKGLLDFSTCTECGRCQSQCPAWNTEKPLSPKLLIMAMRDHAMAKGPLMLADTDEKRAKLLEGSDTLTREAERPMVGDTGDDWFYMPEDGSGVIDPDVLWSCVTCGACVNQCPVDIEHVDHIVDMRRYQVLVESNFPAELNQLFKGMENKGNPWNMSPTARMDWAKDLPFDVKVVGDDIESLDEVEWLFWVGCAGAYEDRAKKTTRAVAELLDIAGVSFGVLGNGETCTGDSARRAGNEFVFQGLAQQNIETFKEYKVKKVVSTCAHCFNTLKNEYKEFGIELEVTHHTQLLNRLVREGKLTPVKEGAGAHKRSITYHDPCYIGRHNGVYTPPRELLQVLPGAEYVEMERANERSFCCGAGGARMWMEETIGSRINENRTAEAVGTGADQIAVGCPFCRVMLSDGLTAQQASGDARPEVEVLDVAQMLLASVKGEQATRYLPGSGGEAAAAAPAEAKTQAEAKAAPAEVEPVETPASGGSLFDTPADPEPEAPAAKASGGGSLFDLGGDDEPAAPAEKAAEKPAEKPAAPSGGSLFDIAADEPEAPKAEAPKAEPAKAAEPAAEVPSGGSLFDIAAPEPAATPAVEPVETPAPAAKAEAPKAEAPKAEAPKAEPAAEIPSSGSLFDIAAPEPEKAPEPKDEAPKADKAPQAETVETPAAEAAPEPTSTIPESGSLFDIAAPEPAAPAPTKAAEPEPEPEPEPAKAEEKTKPKASGEAHQPKTDVDINETGSLFDL